jgi:arabinan endo-1,5-alpha-L-arabinosidase
MRFDRLAAAGACLLASTWAAAAAADAPAAPSTAALRAYHNPLAVRLASGALAQNCADPAVLRDPRAKQPTWYLYCTSDPVSRDEKTIPGESGRWHFHMMPIYRSTDLVHWDFVTDAFADRPAGLAAATSGLWAPEPEYLNGRYYLYFTVTDTADAHSPEPGCGEDSAIGVAVAETPVGPWVPAAKPVVGPRRAGPGCAFQWTYDPKVVEDKGQKWLYYGSYGGGMFVQRLRADGMATEGEAQRVGAPGRYEGAEVVQRDGWWYLFASATNCCNGPLTGYGVFAGRARTPAGPFLDRIGQDMASGRAGGTPVLTQNGNRWVGPGHNTVFTDAAGQWWTIYHAIDTGNPFFSAPDALTRRVALLDRIDWVDGWPVAGGGLAPSDGAMAAPWTAAEGHPAAWTAPAVAASRARTLWADDLRGPRLNPRWTWRRPPGDAAWTLGSAGLRMDTQAADLYVDTNTAGVLQAPLPDGDYRVEVLVTLDAPDDCCATSVQAGLVIMADDDNYVKLVEMAHNGLRQVEFGKEVVAGEAGWPRYGNTVVGTPAKTTWLRIDVHRTGGDERYTAYSSADGRTWVGGGAWLHRLGPRARLGLVAMGGAGRHATFSRVAVSALSR